MDVTSILQIPGGFGGLELVVILSILLLMGLGFLFVVSLLRRLGGPDEERIDELERRVEELESERGE